MADVKISQLTAIASLVDADLLEVVDDPSGTALSRKATFIQVGTLLAVQTQTLTNKSGDISQWTNDSNYLTSISGLAPDTATTQATQPNITSLGTLVSLQVDNININGNTISSTAGTDLLITPLAGQQIVLDGAIVVDAGVVTGATSITSTSFIGALTGNADTVTTNANLTGEITSTGNAALLDVTAISGQSTVTPVSGDMVLIEDATDGLLKQVDASNFLSGGGASTALDNLASVAINTTLVSDTDNTDDLGTAAIGWKDVYLRTGKFDGSTSGTTTIQATAVAGITTLILPAATDTLVGLATTDTLSNKDFSDTVTFSSEVDNGNSGAADTIDWTAGNKQKSTLTDNVTYTFSPEPGGACSLIFRLIQDATGSRTVTWPADVNWPGGTAPTLTTTANAVDLVSFYYDGADFHGNFSLDSK